jgi:hypothetical protein
MLLTRFLLPVVLVVGVACAGCGDSSGVNASAATKLVIVTQPGNAASGVAFGTQPVVQIRDDADNLVASGVAVSAAVASGSGTLGGTAQVDAIAGIAAFQNLRVNGTGSHTLVFSSPGLQSATSAPVTVSASVTPLVAIDFDGYASTSALLSDCTRWDCVEDQLTASSGEVTLDATVAPPGATKSMRYRYNHGGNGCNSITLKRAFNFSSPQQEVWAEFKVRWSSNFSTANNSCPPNDHKLIFGDTEAGQSGRWAFYVGADSPPAHTLQVERPSATGGSGGYYLNRNSNPSLVAEQLWNGEWHIVRLHFRHSTTATSGDGVLQVWVDGALKHDESGFNTARPAADGGGADRITGFSFTHNKDDGPPGVDMFLWWGPITVYNINPGW